ncbi:MAG: HNH endonuclease [Rhodospirillales bacterium]|nr:HNH endonuclease [Rhodospirillales bacterium]
MSWRRRRPDPERWAIVRRAVLYRDAYTCQGCGWVGGPFDVDHIVPLHRGGEMYDLGNLQTLCRHTCHKAKTARENVRRRRESTAAERKWRALVNDLC